MTSRTSRLALLAKHYAASPWRSPVVAVVVAVAAFALVAAPRAAGEAASEELRSAVGAVSPSSRDLVADSPGGVVIGGGDAERLSDDLDRIYGATEVALAGIRDDAGPLLGPLLGEGEYVARTAPFPMLAPSGAQDFPVLNIRLAADPLADERLRIVEGERPVAPTADQLIADEPIEVMVSTATAAEMRWSIGEVRRVPGFWSVRLAAVFEAADAGDRSWEHIDSVLEPEVQDDGNRPPVVTGIAYLAPEALGTSPLTERWRLTVWFPVAEVDLDLDRAAELAAELRRFTVAPRELPTTEDGTGATALRFESQALPAIDAVLARSATSAAVLALAASGPLGVVLAIFALTASAVVDARRPVLLLAASRGASPRALRAALGLEGAIVGLPAAAVGIALALLLVSGPVSVPALVGAALLGLAPAVVFAARATPPLRRPVRSDLAARARGPLRLVVELLAIGVAVLATALLLTRGPLTESGGIDPLAVCAPIALAVAAAILLRRLLPAPLLALQRRARRGPGLAAFVGFARAVREPVGAVATLALLVAVAVAVFSSFMLATIATGSATAVRAELGADVRVEGPAVDAAELDRLAGIPGVDALTGVERAGSVIVTSGGNRTTVDLLLVGGAGLAALHPGPADGLVPVDDDEDLPVLVSPDLAADVEGDSLELGDVDATVAGVAADDTGLGAGAWVAVDGSASARLGAGAYTPRTVLIGVAAGADAEEVAAAAVEVLGTGARTTTVDAALGDALDAPTLVALRNGFAVAVGLAAVLVALAVVLGAVIAMAQRRQLADRLGMLGASPRQLVGTVLAESAPPALAAVIVGALLGAALPFLVVAGTDLAPLVGGRTEPPVTADPVALAAILAAALLLSAASLLPALLPVLRRSRRGQP